MSCRPCQRDFAERDLVGCVGQRAVSHDICDGRNYGLGCALRYRETGLLRAGVAYFECDVLNGAGLKEIERDWWRRAQIRLAKRVAGNTAGSGVDEADSGSGRDRGRL